MKYTLNYNDYRKIKRNKYKKLDSLLFELSIYDVLKVINVSDDDIQSIRAHLVLYKRIEKEKVFTYIENNNLCIQKE